MRQSCSLGDGSREPGKPQNDLECVLIDAYHLLTHGVLASVIIQEYRQLWNTTPCDLLHSKLINLRKYIINAKTTTVSAYLTKPHVV